MKYTDSLAHFGIKGQKWGVRRFQEENGTLTREGELRYRSDQPSKSPSGTKQETFTGAQNPNARIKSNSNKVKNELKNLVETKKDSKSEKQQPKMPNEKNMAAAKKLLAAAGAIGLATAAAYGAREGIATIRAYRWLKNSNAILDQSAWKCLKYLSRPF